MSKDGNISQALKKTVLSRRSFLKWSAVMGGTAALAGGGSLGLKTIESMAQEETKQGKWIPAACWLDCGGKGFNKVYVEDGVITRQGTDQTIPDDPLNPQLRSCAKGRAARNTYLDVDRLKYPMKRKHWEPGGGKKELRGRDEWVRISWDEALDIVASELKRIKEKYGNQAIFAPSNTETVTGERMLNLFGGYVSVWGDHSCGTWNASSHMGFCPFSDMENDRIDLYNTQLFVMWGSNHAWSRSPSPMYQLIQYKKNGAKFIYVDPFYNPAAQTVADEWVPIRPATDTTMMLAMAHTLLTEDDPASNPLIDWDFLNRCTIGFDKDHMPEGADPKDNFIDYVLGTYDGQPKSPEWASEICGVPPEKIRWLAREIAKTERVAIRMGPAPARVSNSDSWPQIVLAFGAMTGHIGKSGSMVGYDAGHTMMSQGPNLVRGGWFLTSNNFGRAEKIPNPLSGPPRSFFGTFQRPSYLDDDGVYLINRNETWDAVLDGKFQAGYQKTRDVNIQLIYHEHGDKVNQFPGAMKAIEAHRKVEFVVSHSFFYNPKSQYADVILPVTTQWERYGYISAGMREQVVWASQVMEPYFESKDDAWIHVELGKRLGLDPEKIMPWSVKQEMFNQVSDLTVVTEDGKTYEPLVTITEEDIKEFGFEGKPQQGKIPLKEFKEKGIYHVKRKPGDNLGYIPLKAFCDDPEANPLPTPSGKLEIYAQAYADYVNACGFSEITPQPKYIPPIEGYEDTFSDWGNKVKGEYPLQMFDLHMLRRGHSSGHNTAWLKEAFPHLLIMNINDAESRGIQNEDSVLITSRHGKVLTRVNVTERIIPGAVAMGEGAWVDLDDETGIDRGGCVNVLHGVIKTGQGNFGTQACNVQVEKWTGEPLAPDHLRDPLVPRMEA